jgi:hypothetical protein
MHGGSITAPDSQSHLGRCGHVGVLVRGRQLHPLRQLGSERRCLRQGLRNGGGTPMLRHHQPQHLRVRVEINKSATM